MEGEMGIKLKENLQNQMWVSEIFVLFGLSHVERERTEYRTWIFQRKKEKKMEERKWDVAVTIQN